MDVEWFCVAHMDHLYLCLMLHKGNGGEDESDGEQLPKSSTL